MLQSIQNTHISLTIPGGHGSNLGSHSRHSPYKERPTCILQWPGPGGRWKTWGSCGSGGKCLRWARCMLYKSVAFPLPFWSLKERQGRWRMVVRSTAGAHANSGGRGWGGWGHGGGVGFLWPHQAASTVEFTPVFLKTAQLVQSWQIQQSSKDVLTKQSIRVQVMESRRQVRFWGCLCCQRWFPTVSNRFTFVLFFPWRQHIQILKDDESR